MFSLYLNPRSIFPVLSKMKDEEVRNRYLKHRQLRKVLVDLR